VTVYSGYDNTRGYASVSHSRQWSNDNLETELFITAYSKRQWRRQDLVRGGARHLEKII